MSRAIDTSIQFELVAVKRVSSYAQGQEVIFVQDFLRLIYQLSARRQARSLRSVSPYKAKIKAGIRETCYIPDIRASRFAAAMPGGRLHCDCQYSAIRAHRVLFGPERSL